jgi:hypothetical protein
MEYMSSSPFFKMRVKFLSTTGLMETVFSTFNKKAIAQGNISEPFSAETLLLGSWLRMAVLPQTGARPWLLREDTLLQQSDCLCRAATVGLGNL